MKRAWVWFRDDLRLHDQGALSAALKVSPDHTILVCILDPRVWSTTHGLGPISLPRLGIRRAEFWMASIRALRAAARARGGELLVRTGMPERVLSQLIEAEGPGPVFAQAHVTFEETETERRVAEALGHYGSTLELMDGRTLIPKERLPFPVSELPDVFTAFRKSVEKGAGWPRPLDAPESLPPPSGLEPGRIPEAQELVRAAEASSSNEPSIFPFQGGEAEGLHRLQTWVFDADALATYQETRNGLLRADDSSKLSPWLAMGCVSARTVADTVRAYEETNGENRSTYALIFELLWRDYFAFLALRAGSSLFRRSGIQRRNTPFREDAEKFEAWTLGRTGYPFVDAFMRELRATGFMSNRGRQNVASFLAKTLGIDWRWGAAWFEATLVDYDPATNWGNWQYLSGVGTDPRDRRFNVVKQAFDYDPEGTFVRSWIPELRWLEGAGIHTPWSADRHSAYPAPIVPLERGAGPSRRGEGSSPGRSRRRRKEHQRAPR